MVRRSETGEPRPTRASIPPCPGGLAAGPAVASRRIPNHTGSMTRPRADGTGPRRAPLSDRAVRCEGRPGPVRRDAPAGPGGLSRPPGVVRRFGEPEPRRWPATGGPLGPSRSGGPVARWFATRGPPDCSDGRSVPARGRRRARPASPRHPTPEVRTRRTPASGGRVRSPPATRPPGCAPEPPPRPRGGYLVDPASSYMLVSKIKPCMSKYKLSEAKLQMAH